MSVVTRNDEAYARQFLHGVIQEAENALAAVKDGAWLSAARASNRALIYARSAERHIRDVRRDAQEAASRAES